MQSQNVVDFLKLRASFGMLNMHNIPGNGYWNETRRCKLQVSDK